MISVLTVYICIKLPPQNNSCKIKVWRKTEQLLISINTLHELGFHKIFLLFKETNICIIICISAFQENKKLRYPPEHYD